MLRGRPARVVMSLCFVCLLIPKTLMEPLCSHETLRRVEKLKNSDELKDLNSTLYTPTTDDFKKCPSSTLVCFADEFQVLIQELTYTQSKKRSPDAILRRLALSFKETNQCLECELHKEQGATIFLENLISTLQFMNDQYCSAS